MKYQTYPAYKDSGVEWLGEVPEHWNVAKTSRFFKIAMGATILKDDLIEDGVLPVFSATDGDHYFGRVNKSLVQLLQGDLVIPARGNSIGAVKLVKEPSTTTQTTIYCKKISNKLVSDYVFYFMKGNKSNLFYFTQTAIPQITVEEVSSNSITLPSIAEQQKIAQFLDHETAKIDTLIEKQQRLIELLKEKRQAVISHAVTKGLNPNAPMKDSGVEWLGEVPEHWVVAGFKKYLNEIVDYRGKTPEKHDSGIFLVTARNIKNGKIDYDASQEFIAEADYAEVMSRGKPKIGDLLFTTEAPLGEVASVDREDIALAQRIIKFDGQSGVLNNDYLKYLIMSKSFQQSLMMFASGSTALGIKAERFVYLRVLIPPEKEQIKIVEHIESISKKIDNLIFKAVEAIEFMQERRTALISAAVTGKIDVRNWNAPNV